MILGKRAIMLLPVLALSACAVPSQTAPVVVVTPQGASINQSTPSQRIENPLRGTHRDEVVTLDELREARSSKGSGTNSGDKVNAPALRENAIRYGTQGGLAWGTRQVQALLRDRATELGRTYDFNALAERSPGSSAISMPPVLVEGKSPSELQDGGRTLRIANTYFEIVKPSKLVERAPIWQTYLDMEACCGHASNEPSEPLPRNDAERDLWKRYVTEGWNEGLIQAQDIFQANMRTMQRDFTGMARAKRLMEEGKLSRTMISESSLGNTGSGQNMRENDKVVRITRDSRLNVGAGRDWHAAVGSAPVGEAAVPTGDDQPQPRTSEAERGGRIVPGSHPGRMPSQTSPQRGTRSSAVTSSDTGPGASAMSNSEGGWSDSASSPLNTSRAPQVRDAAPAAMPDNARSSGSNTASMPDIGNSRGY